ncbi:MAG: tyrosine-type recombinase/integrase [Xanthomonadaceae bacterium]|nr:tyrosine-type recombinase/integrase [Xanthomonadaceae bacterium]
MGRKATPLDARTARGLKPGEWASRAIAGAGAGTLEARGLASGHVAYYARFTANGRQRRIALGSALTYRDAVQQATALSVRHQTEGGDLAATLEAEQAARDRKHEEAKAADARTLGALLTAYADKLERDGKRSAREVRGSLTLHVEKAWPKLWAAPLRNITAESLLPVVGKVANAGNLRQAEKMRAHLRAAFAAGIRARMDAKSPEALRALRVTENPAAALVPIEGANKARTRALSLAELRAYWKRIQDPDHAALRLHLLTGAQRIQQLARATVADYDADTQALRLLDPKGRRTTPRTHMVPLLPEALQAIHDMHGGASGPHLFTCTAGKSGMDASGMAKRVRAVADAMAAAGELEGARFTPGDIRRTVETQLAAAGIQSDALARLQSHGLGGVQARHYNVHRYLPEMRAALETLRRLCTDEQGGNVVALRRQRNG